MAAEAPVPRRRRAPRSTLPPRHRRSRGTPWGVGGLVLVALLGAGKFWLRAHDRRVPDQDRTLDRLLERTELPEPELPLIGPTPGEAERRLVVDLAAVETTIGFKGRPDAVSFQCVSFPDGTHHLIYDYTDDSDDDAPMWLCTIIRVQSDVIAKATFRGIVDRYRRVGFGEEGTELRHGDESADLRFDEECGRAFVCRDGRHVFVFNCLGLELAEGDLPRLLAPYLQRFTTWKP